jgi:hypothetical protein
MEFHGPRDFVSMASHLQNVQAMQRSWFVAVLVVGVTALVGCAGEERPPMDPSSDPSFVPPGQGDLEIGADPAVKEKRAPRARKLLQPNRADKLQAKSE